MEEQLKTGTTTVGILCRDGIVLAADMRATAGTMIADKRAEKVHIISDDFALTIAGGVSDAQLLIKLVRAELKLKEVRTGKRPAGKEAANLLGGLLYSTIRRPTMLPGIVHFLLGGKDKTGFCLYDLYPDGSISKARDFVSSGSGSVFAYGVLETQYKQEMSMQEGIALATKAINTALQRDSASGNGIDIVVITDKGIRKVLHKEVTVRLE